MRLTLRVLLAGAEASQPISQYITRSDLWAVTVSKEMVEKFARVLDGMCLGVTLQLYDGLHSLCRAADMEVMVLKQIPLVEKAKVVKRKTGAGYRKI